MTARTTLVRRWLDRMTFRREAILLEDGRPFGAVMEPWQAEDFAALDDPAHRHGYLERPRGHSKTGDLGTEAVTELMLGAPGSQLYCVAADEDQARLLFLDVAGKFRRSPLLASLVKILRTQITVMATNSTLTVLSSDAPSAWGLRPNWMAFDELVEQRRRDLWDSLWTATGKRPRCRMLVISTAGWDKTSIAWEVRQMAEREANWLLASRGQCASWIDPAWLAQQARSLPPHVYARLHDNRWVDAVGAFLTAAEVDGIFEPDPTPLDGAPWVHGLDLGLTKDRTVRVRLQADPRTRRVVVGGWQTWVPPAGGKVDLLDVEHDVAEAALRDRARVVLDPWQGVLLAQRLRLRGIRVEEQPFTGDARRGLFGTVLDLVRTGRLRCAPHAELRRELLGLEVQETAAGWRVDHRVGRHDDHVVALAMAASAALDRARAPAFCL